MEEKLISKKKPFYGISKDLSLFLKKYDRWMDTPICYDDLLRFSGSVNVYDKNDKDTLWVRTYYSDSYRKEIDFNLKTIYTLLHSDGNISFYLTSILMQLIIVRLGTLSLLGLKSEIL